MELQTRPVLRSRYGRNSGRAMQSIRFILSFNGDLLQAAMSQCDSLTQGAR